MIKFSFSKIILLASLIFTFAACKTDVNHISGTLRNAGVTEGTFDEITSSNTTEIQKIKINADGTYSINLVQPLKAGIYRIKVSDKQLNLILNGKEKDIKVNTDLATFKTTQYSVEGADDTKTYLNIMNDMQQGNKKPEEIVNFVQTTPNPLVAMVTALNVQEFASPEYLPVMTQISDRLNQTYPGSSYAKDFASTLLQLRKYLATMTTVGSVAPEIAMTSTDSKVLKLSDLKGKIVLIDFWASWCGPCRRSNPALVQTYNKYKSKGLEIFSVSLDKNKEAWLSAIQKDGLLWTHHVSDLNGWDNAAAVQYKVQGIPKQYLLDRAGKIIAISEDGGNLEGAIEKAVQ